MSTRKLIKAIQHLSRQIWKLSRVAIKGLMNWLLRSLLVVGRRQHLARSGFVLPTVAMVSLVVVLLTIALMLRSFDRSKNASNFRVNEAVLNAATPAIDRAKAKLDALFDDPTLPRATPSDVALYNAIKTSPRYTFGDEARLKLASEFNGTTNIQGNTAALENDETLTTSWKFPVDTDNNGKFDSYTLYGIYFRSPSRNSTTGQFARSRTPLDARTPPMDDSALGNQCEALGTSASLVGDSGWYKASGKLKKSFFVFTANVPITAAPTNPSVGTAGNYEVYKGNKGFSALEFQQDRSRIPLPNNAVVFEDDLQITPGPGFNLNGSVVTNSNLLISEPNQAVTLYQVSSPYSCYYEEEASKILAGGNVGSGNIAQASDVANQVRVDLFQGRRQNPDTAKGIDSSNKTTDNNPRDISYNNAAYAARIDFLIQAVLNGNTQTLSGTFPSQAVSSNDPPDVKNRVRVRINSDNSLDANQVRREELETYFRKRTRRVPWQEVRFGANPLLDSTGTAYTLANVLQGNTGDRSTLRPPDAWMYPTDPTDGKTGTNYTKLTLKGENGGQTLMLRATESTKQKELNKEALLGDRVLVGNGLPELWYDSTASNFVSASKPQPISGVKWNNPNNGAADTSLPANRQTRNRYTRVRQLADLGITDRDGFWEKAAAQNSTGILDNYGGLRVVTGAGLYLPSSAVPSTIPASTTVWPDSMPVPGNGNVYDGNTLLTDSASTRPYLRMRASSVYHYKNSFYDPAAPTTYQEPLACVSSYYDPTNSTTAKNQDGLPDISLRDTSLASPQRAFNSLGTVAAGAGGNSNNGVVYAWPNTATFSNSFTWAGTSRTYRQYLDYQASLVYPNGRKVNEVLANALAKLNSTGGLISNTAPLTLSERTAVDAAICSLSILEAPTGFQSASTASVPQGAIYETAFLNPEQIRAIDQNDSDPAAVETFTGGSGLTGNYDLSIEERQPLEIRATVLDLDLLRQKTIGSSSPTQEYLLPNSGVIYASRDDALPDLSNTSADVNTKKLQSPLDFKLDPTRRPNGVMLINGSNISRESSYRAEEKGLILATNLPAYVKGDFNLHSYEEFTQTLNQANWDDSGANGFYKRTTLDTNFACRPGQFGTGSCTPGDSWRPASVLADNITLFSGDFRLGFRNEGDYSLNNNQGDKTSIDKYKKNGFFANDYVTSRDFSDAAFSTTTGSGYQGSSYFNNFVTPIQRRVNFSEYLMEVCTKLPVSECGPSDWYVNPATNTRASTQVGQSYSLTDYPAGTTAEASNALYRQYPRRVAVLRQPSQKLVLTEPASGRASPIPIGVDSSGTIKPYPYTGTVNWNGTSYAAFSSSKPRNTDSALWYRTSGNADNPTGSDKYDKTYPLQFLVQSNLLLPQTVCVKNTATAGSMVSCPSTFDSTVANLNLPNPDDPTNQASGYSVCVFASNAGNTQRYQSTATNFTGTCPGSNNDTSTVSGVIKSARDVLGNLTAPNPTGLLSSAGGTLIAANSVNVATLPSGGFNNNTTITLRASAANPNPVFVLKAPSGSFNFGSNSCGTLNTTACNGVRVVLDGVDENNVFWILDNGNVKFQDVNTAAQVAANPTSLWGHTLQGTVFGGSSMHLGNNATIIGRLLGNSNAVQFSNGSTSNVTAVVSNDQPLFVPVLQLQVTTATPSDTTFQDRIENSTIVDGTRWQQPATATKFNLVAASGNTPGRAPNPSDSTTKAEPDAGLPGFIHFQENWNGVNAQIFGSFIQFKRSTYATAPAQPVFLTATDDAAVGGIFGYPQAYRTGSGKPSTKTLGVLPYYMAPNRRWGFDVALLTQLPDLFAQRFTLPPAGEPDEFFREVDRNDPWVQTLLCAAEASDRVGAAGSTTTYTNPAIPDRPSNCPSLPYPTN